MPVFAREISSNTTIAKATNYEDYVSDLKGLKKVGDQIATFGKGDKMYKLIAITKGVPEYQVTEYVLDRASGTRSAVTSATTIKGIQGVLNHQGAGLPGS